MSESSGRLPNAARYRDLRARERVITITRTMPHAPETIMRYLGQVDMLNALAGNPRPVYSYLPAAGGGTVTRAEAKKGGLTIRYDELPYEWSKPFWARAETFQESGPLAYVGLEYALERVPEGTRVVLHGRRATRGTGFLGWLVVRQYMASAARALDKIKKTALAPAQDPLAIAPYVEEQNDSGVDRATLSQRLAPLHANSRVTASVAAFVASAPDKMVLRLRPLQVAFHYGLPEQDTIEFFLRATRAGFFNLSWDLLCPTCRGDKARFTSLSGLETQAHCDYCNIEYGADFTNNVELTFRPVPALRALNGGSFCINSPGNTAFIHAQLNVWPDASTKTELAFDEVRYRLRSPQFPGVREVLISESAPRTRTVNVASELDGRPRSEPLLLAPRTELEFVNDGDSLVTVKLFRDAYRDFALTAARVTALQEFRDQFSAEALAPDLQIGVENLCFLFTDLKDSTPMYERLGDAPAFALVRDHFTILIDEVRKHEGAVVKTIGDAVMAVFIDSTNALRAAIGIQRRIHNEHRSVSVKIGLQAGPSLAVNSNDRLDYFGTTVNRAARIQSMADGNDIVMPLDLEATAGELLPTGFVRSEFQATLKGLANDAQLVRWQMADASATAPRSG
ncbi:MAG: adenylate/guanylate cyclase domain-containing protein [Spirochaetales bacterium]|nr:adenylate/guanylate cyclase domain-containing protein [Leptospiraceae bacterium]MCP5481337.1 adenylate/guanylate cyclase domain-containing protein [Spirochaetales bacterium]MCP5485775.1 adenylate/guanylate cyclase domain-containing protein [Spirochaetales bacterium]